MQGLNKAKQSPTAGKSTNCNSLYENQYGGASQS